MESIIMQKKKEREEQEVLLKPQKQKIVMEDVVEQKKIHDFNEMKEEQTEYLNTHKKAVEENKTRYDGILNNLKNLGILNN